jgi:hypothetical protein
MAMPPHIERGRKHSKQVDRRRFEETLWRAGMIGQKTHREARPVKPGASEELIRLVSKETEGLFFDC